ncbi:hypothetical protein KUCAC02_012401 [Chaenocephalus aceratus]|uniref:Uncharacterized protein n=1 Tax=Chaenocephalus aceratus TaxID=36190 RepID=A0ACB9XCL5_CHAAC|nr:hypothetical protein KUCAC02_012401 [Chaenocephalus aceratus]
MVEHLVYRYALLTSRTPPSLLPRAQETQRTQNLAPKTQIFMRPSNTVGPPGAALLWDPAQRAHFKELPPPEKALPTSRRENKGRVFTTLLLLRPWSQHLVLFLHPASSSSLRRTPLPPHVMAQVWYATSGGCRTARAWMKSANRVEVVWGPVRGQRGPVRGPTGHHLLGSGARGDGPPGGGSDSLHLQEFGAENQDELQAQSGLQRLGLFRSHLPKPGVVTETSRHPPH